MEPGNQPAGEPRPAFPAGAHGSDYLSLQAHAQAFEEAVSMALFAAAWLQHAGKDPRASRGAQVVARLLAACSGQPTLHGPDTFAAARKFLEDEYE